VGRVRFGLYVCSINYFLLLILHVNEVNLLQGSSLASICPFGSFLLTKLFLRGSTEADVLYSTVDMILTVFDFVQGVDALRYRTPNELQSSFAIFS